LKNSAASSIKPSPADLNFEMRFELGSAPLLIAMSGAGQPGGLVSLLPFVIILGIFYVMILMPMQKRQKKVQEFQNALKVGDKIITTSGIYGQITRVNDKSVQVQVADKVRIEIARASIGGYQGQEPVVPETNS
jgi:preprotein translocase subunit YajC